MPLQVRHKSHTKRRAWCQVPGLRKSHRPWWAPVHHEGHAVSKRVRDVFMEAFLVNLNQYTCIKHINLTIRLVVLIGLIGLVGLIGLIGLESQGLPCTCLRRVKIPKARH